MPIYQYERIINEFIHPEVTNAKEEEKIIKSIFEIIGFNPKIILILELFLQFMKEWYVSVGGLNL